MVHNFMTGRGQKVGDSCEILTINSIVLITIKMITLQVLGLRTKIK